MITPVITYFDMSMKYFPRFSFHVPSALADIGFCYLLYINITLRHLSLFFVPFIHSFLIIYC